jgi:NAD(P)-dependent dehydrogenase (short-subunit alcohol dehydrogenase family)
MASNSKAPVTVVAGVGPGLGAALARRFALSYPVALIARGQHYVEQLTAEIKAAGGIALPVAADVTQPHEVADAFELIKRELGNVHILLYNAGNAFFGSIREITAEQFEANWRVCALGAFLCVKAAIDDMTQRAGGTILFTGATAGVKAGARSAAFGPAKFALRGLAQSLARDLGPRGIHVAYINVDGMIDEPRVRSRMPNADPEDLLKPEAIADTYWHLAHQDRSAWTMELDLRPFKEKF